MRELLVIADQNADSNPAFLHALEVAKNTGAKIEFVGFVHAAGVDSSEILTQSEKRKVHHEFIDRKQAQIDGFLSKLDLRLYPKYMYIFNIFVFTFSFKIIIHNMID